jgi:hypothetical protein
MPTIKAYHGSDYKIEKFIHFQKEFTNDQYGPGIYFTNKESVAKGYGKYIYEVKLDLKGFLTRKSKRDDTKLLRIINDNLTETVLLNYDDNLTRAKRLLIQSVLLPKISYIECLLNIWSDVFNLKNSRFMKACVENGINGIIEEIDTSNGKTLFYMVYNTENIK